MEDSQNQAFKKAGQGVAIRKLTRVMAMYSRLLVPGWVHVMKEKMGML